MKFLFYLTIFFLVGGLICAKTKPTKAEHVKVVSVVVADEIKNGNLFPELKDTPLAWVATNPEAMRHLIDKMLVFESYGVFTLGKVKWEGKEYVVSLGILGKVFTFADAKVADDFIKSFKNIDVEQLFKAKK